MPVFVIAKPLADGGGARRRARGGGARPLARRLPARVGRVGGEIIGNAADGMGLSLLVARPAHSRGRARAAPCARRAATTCAASRSAPTPRASMRRRCACARLSGYRDAHDVRVQPAAARSRAPRSWRSTPMCRARAASPGWPRSTSFRRTNRRSAPRRWRSRRFERSPTISRSIPTARRRVLREAIARRYGLDAAQIICGNGSDEILALLAHVYLRPGDEGLYSRVWLPRISDRHPRGRRRRRSSPRRATRRPTSTRCCAR